MKPRLEANIRKSSEHCSSDVAHFYGNTSLIYNWDRMCTVKYVSGLLLQLSATFNSSGATVRSPDFTAYFRFHSIATALSTENPFKQVQSCNQFVQNFKFSVIPLHCAINWFQTALRLPSSSISLSWRWKQTYRIIGTWQSPDWPVSIQKRKDRLNQTEFSKLVQLGSSNRIKPIFEHIPFTQCHPEVHRSLWLSQHQ